MIIIYYIYIMITNIIIIFLVRDGRAEAAKKVRGDGSGTAGTPFQTKFYA